MKIAVTYENGTVFQHFGHTETFKIYDIEENKVVSSQVIPTDGAGHEALAQFLADLDVDVVIAGGMGSGAQGALLEAGIMTVTGASGDADAAVEAYLAGELESEGCNCHEHEEGECEGGCGGHCHGCGGHCGEMHIMLEGKNAGKTVRVHYTGTFNDGTKFDSSLDRGEPLEFISGAGMMIPGFDKAVVNMEVGEQVDIHLMPEEAYGMPDPRRILVAEIAKLPGSEGLEIGQQVYLRGANGAPIPVRVTEKTETTITLDANSEMAGKELNFHIGLVEVLEEEA